MKRQQQGFTLIELVIVIVILGILAAFALPRFADLSADARVSAIKGAAGAMKSASSIAHSACLADSGCNENSSGDTINLDGQDIELDFGYPDGSDAGIQKAAQIDPDDDWEVSTTNTGNLFTVQFASAPDSANCIAAFAPATKSGTGSGSFASVTTSTGGC